MKRLGIFGGTFNPPHLGHLIVARHVARRLSLERVFFVPSFISPHKRKGEDQLSKHRLTMVKLAVAGDPLFEVWEGEMKRKGPSYTYRTLEEFAKRFPKTHLFFLIGADNFPDFRRWMLPDRILELATLVVMSRPDFKLPRTEKRRNPAIRFLRVPAVDTSSSLVRNATKKKDPIVGLVPPDVVEYIRRHKLYR
ncbi:MAG TPA: nicotinate-nucleotide adenylyltransferase [Bacteroidota bacterium]|nr:nicotinate-nucleotide adenylyltransferase [Bacteroidota bacterium]